MAVPQLSRLSQQILSDSPIRSDVLPVLQGATGGLADAALGAS